MSQLAEKAKQLAAKQVFKNGVWLYLLQVFNTVVPLITLPYITRILGPSQYGLFSIALNLQGYYQVIVEYGFGMSATRKVALQENTAASLSVLYSRVLCSRSLLMLPCCLFTLGYVAFNFNDFEQCVCLVILTASMLGYVFQLNWLFQGMQCMRFISIINIIGRTLSVLLIFIFIKNENDLLLYCCLYSITPIMVGLLSNIVARRQFGVYFRAVHLQEIFDELKSGWFVFTTQLSSKVFGAIGLTLLGVFSSTYETGVYAAIQKIPMVILLAWSPISQVLYPVSSKRMADSFTEGRHFVRKVRRLILPPFVCVAILLAVFAEPVISIVFGRDYATRYYWVYPLLIWMIVAINNNFLGIQILLASGHDKEYSRCFNVSLIFTIVLNVILIYLFKGDGACWVPLLSEAVLWVLLVIAFRRMTKEE